MATHFFKNMSDHYDYVFNQIADPRVSDWWLMSSPWQLLGLLASYLYFSKRCGPKFMCNRQPFNLRPIIIAYNAAQVVASCYMVLALLDAGWLNKFSLGCEPVDYSQNADAMRLLTLCWYGLLLRIADLLETVFFILRKKHSQASFLHLYHHVSTLLLIWTGTKYVGGGMATFPLLLNSGVHAIMYSYYLASSLGRPAVTAAILPWKRSLTTIQMVQFVVIFVHGLSALQHDCPLPKALTFIYFPNVAIIFYLFYDFYQKAYKCATKKVLH